jgi:cardiolipin synthase
VYLLLHLLIITGLVIRILLRPHREPTSRIAWIAVVSVLPLLGLVAYLVLGEVRLGRWRRERLLRARAALPRHREHEQHDQAVAPSALPERIRPLFTLGHTINGFRPHSGNRALLLPGPDEAIDALVADIDAARGHVHLLFYIWLPDNNGLKVVAALKRAAARGVACRALADDLGSRLLIRSEHWRAMEAAGVRLARALPRRPFLSRMDLRNHRKIAVIDHHITYCGSQNCADPAFAIKAKYAPWVDVMARFEGPVARQNQYLFLSDWSAHVDEELGQLLQHPLPPPNDATLVAQAIGTGPTTRALAMPEVFETLIYAARRELVITTPYFVPNESLLIALCNCARRGVETTMVFPARNDSRVVAAASRSYYADLLAAGVRIFEYAGGLLHAKTLTLDGEVTLIGSANLDRRSFDLNFENNVLLWDEAFSRTVRARQESYLARSRALTAAEVAAWPWTRRLWNNAVAMLGPVI